MITVYHGGYKPVKEPEIRVGRIQRISGMVFTVQLFIKEQAQRWARRYDRKIVSIYDVRLDTKLDIKEFYQ